MLDVKQVIAKRKCEKMSGRLTFGREIMSLVYVMHREFEKRSKQCENRYISPTNAKIIAFLAENRGRDVCQRDIEKKFDVRRSSVSKVLKNMEEKEIIMREKVSGDARLKKIVLTDSAKSMIKNIESIHGEIEEKTLDGIPQKDLDTFYKVITKMRENIQKE